MPVQIPNHSHCVICSRAVSFGEKTCTAECAAQYEDLQRRRKRTMMFLYGLMALSVLVLLLGQFGGSFGL